MLYSDVAALQKNNSMDRTSPSMAGGKVRVMNATLKAASAEKNAIMCELPAGIIRVLELKLNAALGTPDTTLKFGLGSYVTPNGVTIAADDEALSEAQASNALKDVTFPGGLQLDSQRAIPVTLTASANLALDDIVCMTLYYVSD